MAKATNAIYQRRLDDMIGWRLKLATLRHIRRYVSESARNDDSPWKLEPDQKPLDDRTLTRYIRDADAVITQKTTAKRSERIRRHLALRDELFLQAFEKGDFKTALAITDSQAKLEDLYPSEGRTLDKQIKRLELLAAQGETSALPTAPVAPDPDPDPEETEGESTTSDGREPSPEAPRADPG